MAVGAFVRSPVSHSLEWLLFALMAIDRAVAVLLGVLRRGSWKVTELPRVLPSPLTGVILILESFGDDLEEFLGILLMSSLLKN